MSEFTREQLAEVAGWSGMEPCPNLAAFAIALLDQNEALRRDKFQLGEERAAEWKRAEKAEAERDEAKAERDDAIDRWARRAREAEATCKELLQVQAERDRLREELREAEEAIRQADNRTADPGDLSREGYSIDFCKRVGVWLNSPAVVRARERGGKQT